jgi:hypothetical protein
MKNSTLRLITLSIFLSAIAIGISLTPASAAQPILPEPSGKEVTGCTSKNCGNYTLDDFLLMAVNISNWILGLVGSVALLFFIYGGVMFTLSAGSEDRVSKGKSILINSVIGLFLVFASYIIVQFVMTTTGFVKPGSDGSVWSNIKNGAQWESRQK